MNSLLVKNRPEYMSKEEFEKSWNNIGYTLQALYTTLYTMKDSLSTVKAEDFDCPNHYAKLAFQAGKQAMLDTIIDMLPESSKQ